MSSPFTIDLEWFPYEAGDEVARHFSAWLEMWAGGQCLTRLEDRRGKTVRDRMYGCAWQLAQWFAANWWRLRWESGHRQSKRDGIDWGMSHGMASAGGGFIWPNITFDSDGEMVEIELLPDTQPKPHEPVRYLNSVNTQIPVSEFERTVDGFLDAVLRRGEAMGTGNKEVAELWGEVSAERLDPEASRYRKWEAIAGYDPDEAPEPLMKWIEKASRQYGQQAAEEVAAGAGHQTSEALEAVRDAKPTVEITVPPLPASCRAEASEQPWQRGERAARAARKKWGLGDGPISGAALAELLGTRDGALLDSESVPVPFPLALQDGARKLGLCLPRRSPESRRFAVCRVVGDCLMSGGERLRPATDAGTARQKFQRAFAAAFLCPSDALEDKLGVPDPSGDDMDDAAAYFEVSPLLVRSVLVNKGWLDRDSLLQRDAG